MATSKSASEKPRWTDGATRYQAFLRGMAEAPSVSVLVIITMFIGFGALARDVGLDALEAIFVSATVFALPGQVVLADQIAKGATMAGAFFAVTLTAIRLLPLTASLLPHMRDGITPRWCEYPIAHIIAVTTWVESMRRLPPLPLSLRVPYYAGFGTVLFSANLIATLIGYSIAGAVPPALAATLIFLTPVYFFLSLISAAQDWSDAVALPLGFVMGPLIYLFAPGFDLVITGLVGGSLAYAYLRWREGRA